MTSGIWDGGRFVLASTIEERQRIFIRGIKAVRELIANSDGVSGLHLNGDMAPWSELQTCGRFEGWLKDFDAASDLVNRMEK